MWHKSVEVDAFASPAEREHGMQQQVDEILAKLDTQPAVKQARGSMEDAQKLSRRLKQVQGELMKRTGRMLEELRSASEDLEDQLADGKTVAAGLDLLMRLDAEHRLTTGANKRLAELRIPRAEIDEMEKTAKFLLTRGAALREEARKRLEKTAKLISGAAEFEGTITFDPSQTISGALTARAERMETQADNYRRWAAERAEQHDKLLKQAGF